MKTHGYHSSLASRVAELEPFLETKKKYRKEAIVAVVEIGSGVDEAAVTLKLEKVSG